MARIKLAYIGGGSTRAAGTMASFIEQGASFDISTRTVCASCRPSRRKWHARAAWT